MTRLFAACFVLLSTLGTAQELTNEKIWYSGEFRGEYVSGLRSMKDGVHYTTLDYDEALGSKIVKYAYESGEEVATIATSQAVFADPSIAISDYAFSADEQKLLISTEVESIYRYSSKANYYIYDLEKERAFPLTDFAKGKQRLADFSPGANKVAFVRDNNLFVTDLRTREEVQITSDGKENHLINGATDWVYEEEFGFDKGFYWSPKGDRIAYYKFDESKVKQFQMAMYGELYPEQYTFKYPKAGERNSVVSIFVYELSDGKSASNGRSALVETGDTKDQYIPRIQWTANNDQLCVMRMNRLQNKLEFLLADCNSENPFQLQTKNLYLEEAKTYIDIHDNLIFLNDGKGFLWTSEKDGYNHIYHFGMDGKEVRQITSGAWDVISFLGFDEKRGTLFFTSAQDSPLEAHVYSIGLKRGKPQKLSEKAGRNNASFSADFSFYINYHSDANTPYYITLHNSKGKLVRVLKDNARLKETLARYPLSPKTFFTVTNRHGDALNCSMIKPADFDPNKTYPVFVNVYGGPGSNIVSNSWGGANYLFHQMLAQNGYIVVSCDPRGTMYRGRDWKHSTYLQLGKLETEDFMDLARQLGDMDYIDSERIGIMGWSYGGYMSSLCMTVGAPLFKMGIAVAPVTNWRFYDTIYTERFMRTPQENPDGYDDNSPINHVDKLQGKYFLIHGSADDNVHYQNTMEMINALVKANKQFDHFIYPDRNHGIYGGNTRLHLFEMMSDYIFENL